jgi:hypothetical protein
MPWREVVLGDTRWSVVPVAERVPSAESWQLVLSCRVPGDSGRSVWANTGLHASSRNDLYAQADRMSDARVVAVLTRHLAAMG